MTPSPACSDDGQVDAAPTTTDTPSPEHRPRVHAGPDQTLTTPAPRPLLRPLPGTISRIRTVVEAQQSSKRGRPGAQARPARLRFACCRQRRGRPGHTQPWMSPHRPTFDQPSRHSGKAGKGPLDYHLGDLPACRSDWQPQAHVWHQCRSIANTQPSHTTVRLRRQPAM